MSEIWALHFWSLVNYENEQRGEVLGYRLGFNVLVQGLLSYMGFVGTMGWWSWL
jgi:hypothetical protein